MTAEVQGVVAMTKGEPVSLVTIVVPDPGPGEAVVRVQACGVCHTDLHYRRRDQRRVPVPPGPRGRRCGRSRRALRDLRGTRPTSWSSTACRLAGECRSCLRGRPWYCFDTFNAVREDDTHRRDTPLAGAGHRGLCRKDAGGRGPVHQSGPGRPARGGRSAGLWGDGRPGLGHVDR